MGSNPYFWWSHSRKGINPVVNLGLMLSQLQQMWLTVTWCTVQPESLTPASNTCSWAFIPLNEGSSEGCTFSKCPLHLRTNLPIKQRNKQQLIYYMQREYANWRVCSRWFSLFAIQHNHPHHDIASKPSSTMLWVIFNYFTYILLGPDLTQSGWKPGRVD